MRLARIATALAVAAATVTASAEQSKHVPLTVIYDSHNTVSIMPLVESSGFGDGPESNPEAQFAADRATLATAKAYGEAFAAQVTKIESHRMTPGRQSRMPTGDRGKVLPRPMFLVGADPGSMAWLNQHLPRLREIAAVGLIVQANGRADIERIKRLVGPDIPLATGSGDTLATHFGIQHYPVIIGPDWIEQ